MMGGITLQAHGKTRGIHHDEHVLQAPIGLADQVAGGARAFAEGHHAGGAGMDAEFVFDRNTAQVIALTQRTVGADQHLRHQEQRYAAHALGRTVNARQHHVDDVVREIVVAPGDEDLLAEEPKFIDGQVAALGHRAGADQGQVGPGLRLGEHHGAGPFARHHFRQVALFQLRRSGNFQGVDGPIGQHRTQLEGEVRGSPGLLHRSGQYQRHALSADLGRRPQLRPAARDELLIGLAKAGGRAHARFAPVRTFLVAAAIDGIQDPFGEARRFAEHGIRQGLRPQ
jgi:hypothetical protein